MAHECGCHRDPTIDAGHFPGRVDSDETVGDVVRRRPGALETLKEMGINHCCGAHLTLREAAVAAGVPLDAMLAALGGTPKTPA